MRWLIPFLLITFLGTVFFFGQEQSVSCPDLPFRRCVYEQTERFIARSDIAGVLAYMKSDVQLHGDHGLVHMTMHRIGAAAYSHEGSITKAMAVLPEISLGEDFFFYNGFKHGVFEAFFVEHPTESDRDLAEAACGDYFSLETVDTTDSIHAEECFHAIGHAVMMHNGNDIPLSLAACDELPQSWMRSWCYHGAFMENFYLFTPWYSHESPRPYAQGTTMLPFCRSQPERYRAACYDQLSWVYLETHPGDFAGAFNECASLPQENARICVARAGRIYIPRETKANIGAVERICALAGTYEKECVLGTVIGISQDAAGSLAASTPLCNSLSRWQRECSEAITRSKESLARMYLTEL